MQSSNIINIEAMFTFKEWNNEMTELYNKYSMVRELNHDLMRVCPIYAMYTLSEYLKRKRTDVEVKIAEFAKDLFDRAGRDPEALIEANRIVEEKTYETLRPVVEDYIKARTYYVCAMQGDKEKFNELLIRRDEQARRTK